MHQRSLFDPPPQPPPAPDTIQARFEAFHCANPHVFGRFLAAARALKASGRTRFGAKLIYERMRYEEGVRSDGAPFVLDNNFTSRYARLLLSECPGEFEECLELRRLRA